MQLYLIWVQRSVVYDNNDSFGAIISRHQPFAVVDPLNHVDPPNRLAALDIIDKQLDIITIVQ